MIKIKAIPHNEAKAFTERFCSKAKFRKRRNTVCISSFLNRRIGAKDPVKAADELCGVALIQFPTELYVFCRVCFARREMQMEFAIQTLSQGAYICYNEKIDKN